MVRRGGGGFTVLIHRTPLVKVPVKFPALAVAVVAKESLKTLANHMEHELQTGLRQPGFVDGIHGRIICQSAIKNDSRPILLARK